jgi:type II secretory pathway component GspD/PulD (secretin)
MGMGGMGGMGGGNGMNGQGSGGMRGGSFDMSQLSQLIENTIAPDTWYDTSDYGEGMIVAYPSYMATQSMPRKLAITQTREIHRQVEQLLDELRKSLGPQVSIEARFLTVSKGFLEDIGLDVDMVLRPGGKWGAVNILQNAVAGSKASATDVPGSMGNTAAALTGQGQYGTILDDLQVSYLLRATQARNDTKTLSAPRATVMSGDPVIFSLISTFQFALPPDTSQGYQPGLALGTVGATTAVNYQYAQVFTGNMIQMTPTISKDKKHVLLTIDVVRDRLVGIRTQEVETITTTASGGAVPIKISVSTPETEEAALSTRVSIPDGGTLLLGGQTVTTEVDKQVGVPILSKIPILGRAFTSNSTVKDQQIMLLLVKPIVILQTERDQDAMTEAEAREAHPF